MIHGNIHRVASFVIALGFLLPVMSEGAGPMDASPDEWPLIRRDARNTGASPLKGNMTKAPGVAASYSLGGRPSEYHLMADLDGDGLVEIITNAGGPIRALNSDGAEMWKTIIPRGYCYLLGTPDLNGDGKLEVVCSSVVPATIHLLNGQTGEVLWEKSYDEQVGFSNGTRFADIDGDGVTDMFILGNSPWINSHQLGWASSFKNDLTNPDRIWGPLDLPFNAHYRPQTIITDFEGDGDNDIVISSAIHFDRGLMVTSFDAKTGFVRRMVFYPNGNRNYGHLQSIKTNHKPEEDVLVIGMLGEAHITYLVNDASRLVEAWHVNETFQIPYNPAIDLDGDGNRELVYTRCPADGEAPTRETVTLVVRDLATGGIVKEWPGLRLHGFVQGGELERPLIIAATVPEKEIVIIRDMDKQEPLPIKKAAPSMIALPLPLNMMNETVPGRSGYDVFTLDVNGDGTPEMFVTTPTSILGVDPITNEIRFRHSFKAHQPMNLIGSGRLFSAEADALLLTGENGYVIVSLDGKRKQEIPLQSNTPGVAIAGRFRPDGPMTVLVTRADGTVAALDGPSLRRGKIDFAFTIGGMNGFQTPAFADHDLDGQREAMLCDNSTREPVAVNEKGRTLKRYPSLPFDGSTLLTGSFVASSSGDGVMGGAVSCVGPNKGIRKWTAWDARSGKMLWQREKGPSPRMTPCVYNLNNDGVEDYAWVHLFDLITVNGKTGEDLWAGYNEAEGYHIVSIADMSGDGKPSMLLSGGYTAIYGYSLDGTKSWTIPGLAYNAGSAAAVADADGGGSLEFGTAFTDRFACYNAATGALKWQLPLRGSGSDVAAADVDGDGKSEFLFGCADGSLYAMESTEDGSAGRILWSVPLGAVVGPPSVADLDGDGLLEILVSTSEGSFKVLATGEVGLEE